MTQEELEERIQKLKGKQPLEMQNIESISYLPTDPNDVPVEFSIHKNLHVVSKIIENGNKPIFDRRPLTSLLPSENCCLSPSGHRAWIFSTRGLSAVAQDELVFIFDEQDVTKPEELIADLLVHIQQIYLDATKGKGCWVSKED